MQSELIFYRSFSPGTSAECGCRQEAEDVIPSWSGALLRHCGTTKAFAGITNLEWRYWRLEKPRKANFPLKHFWELATAWSGNHKKQKLRLIYFLKIVAKLWQCCNSKEVVMGIQHPSERPCQWKVSHVKILEEFTSGTGETRCGLTVTQTANFSHFRAALYHVWDISERRKRLDS